MTGPTATSARRGSWVGALGVPGPGAVLAALAAVGAVLSLVAAVAVDGAAVMLFLLVCGGVALTWWSRLPGVLQAATTLTTTGAAWAGVLGAYEAAGWLDVAVHLLLTGLLAVLATVVLERLGWLRLLPTGRAAEQAGAVVVVMSLGMVLSVLWELGEWAGNSYVDPAIGVGYEDTLGDLTAGGAGAALAGWLWARWVARRRPGGR